MNNDWQRYSSLGLNFVLTVALCSYIGYRLDGRLDTSPYCTLAGILLGIFAASYHLIITVKDLGRK